MRIFWIKISQIYHISERSWTDLNQSFRDLSQCLGWLWNGEVNDALNYCPSVYIQYFWSAPELLAPLGKDVCGGEGMMKNIFTVYELILPLNINNYWHPCICKHNSNVFTFAVSGLYPERCTEVLYSLHILKNTSSN